MTTRDYRIRYYLSATIWVVLCILVALVVRVALHYLIYLPATSGRALSTGEEKVLSDCIYIPIFVLTIVAALYYFSHEEGRVYYDEFEYWGRFTAAGTWIAVFAPILSFAAALYIV